MGLLSWFFDLFKNDEEVCQKPVVTQENRMEILQKITNENHAQAVHQAGLRGIDLPPDVAEAVVCEVQASVAKGQNPLHCKAKNYLPDDFEWPEYDKWYRRFVRNNTWPESWICASIYYVFKAELKKYETRDMLAELDEENLDKIAAVLDVKEYKNLKMEVLIEQIASLFPRRTIVNTAEEILRKDMIEEKKYLFQNWLMNNGIEEDKVKEWAEGGTKRVELSPAPDACDICKKMAKEYSVKKLPELHPGCRCCFVPAASEC